MVESDHLCVFHAYGYRLFSLRLIGSTMFNFKPGHTCRTTVIFGSLKDASLQINISASNNCFINGNIFQNSVNTLSKMVNHFLSKSSKFCILFGPYNFVQIPPACSPNTYHIMYGETSNISISSGNINARSENQFLQQICR